MKNCGAKRLKVKKYKVQVTSKMIIMSNFMKTETEMYSLHSVLTSLSFFSTWWTTGQFSNPEQNNTL